MNAFNSIGQCFSENNPFERNYSRCYNFDTDIYFQLQSNMCCYSGLSVIVYIHQGQFLKHSKDESHFSNMSFTTGSISQLLVCFTKMQLEMIGFM